MIFSFLGDSITEGAWIEKKEDIYYNIVGRKLDVTALGYGIGGTRIAPFDNTKGVDNYPWYFETRVKDIDPKSDFVFVFGGTNDYGHGNALMGSYNEPNTFKGALKSLIKALEKRFDKERIIFITPLHRAFDEDIRGEFCNTKEFGYPLKEYADAIIEYCSMEGIKVIDFFNNPPMDLPTKFEKEEFYNDGLHPTEAGHKKMAEALVSYIKINNLI